MHVRASKEKKIAEKKAREEYDPSNDNLSSIFGGIRKDFQQKLSAAKNLVMRKRG